MESLLFLKNHHLGVAPTVKILRAHDVQRFSEATNLLAEARQRAAAIVTEAEAEAEIRRQRGFQEGVREGKLKVAEQMMDTLNRMAVSLESIEEQVVHTVIRAVRKVIGDMEDRELIAEVVANLMASVRQTRAVNLRVHPDMVEHVRIRVTDLLRDHPTLKYVDVVADSSLAARDCVLESEVGVIDAGVDVQLAAIERSLMQSTNQKNEDRQGRDVA